MIMWRKVSYWSVIYIWREGGKENYELLGDLMRGETFSSVSSGKGRDQRGLRVGTLVECVH